MTAEFERWMDEPVGKNTNGKPLRRRDSVPIPRKPAMQEAFEAGMQARASVEFDMPYGKYIKAPTDYVNYASMPLAESAAQRDWAWIAALRAQGFEVDL